MCEMNFVCGTNLFIKKVCNQEIAHSHTPEHYSPKIPGRQFK